MLSEDFLHGANDFSLQGFSEELIVRMDTKFWPFISLFIYTFELNMGGGGGRHAKEFARPSCLYVEVRWIKKVSSTSRVNGAVGRWKYRSATRLGSVHLIKWHYEFRSCFAFVASLFSTTFLNQNC